MDTDTLVPTARGRERQRGDLAKENPHYGNRELGLGVATNRKTHSAQRGDKRPETEVYFATAGEQVKIDIENDLRLFEFLQEIKVSVTPLVMDSLDPLEVAREVARQVVAKTPNVDQAGTFHQRQRYTTLGEALQQPVECIDRALATEASLKMFGISEARGLIGVDTHPDGTKENNVDVVLKVGSNEYVAISMGSKAGEVISLQEYLEEYLPQRQALGLGKREIHPNWGAPYFETIADVPEKTAEKIAVAPVDANLAPLEAVNRRLQASLSLDSYNAQAVIAEVARILDSPESKNAWAKFEALAQQAYGIPWNAKINDGVREVTSSMGEFTSRAGALARIAEESKLLQALPAILASGLTPEDILIIRHAQLRNEFILKAMFF